MSNMFFDMYIQNLKLDPRSGKVKFEILYKIHLLQNLIKSKYHPMIPLVWGNIYSYFVCILPEYA